MVLARVTDMFRFYAYALIQVLIEPSHFFRKLPEAYTLPRALGFIGISAGFFAGASLMTGAWAGPAVRMGAIFFINAAGLTVIGSIIGFGTMVMMFGKKQPYVLVFSLYAFSFGVPMLVAWLPFFLWLTEPWKWWLVYTGFRQACGLSKARVMAVLLVSVPIQFCLIYSALRAFTG